MHVVKQVVQQSSGSGRSFFIGSGRNRKPSKIEDPAGTNRPELSSGAPLVFVYKFALFLLLEAAEFMYVNHAVMYTLIVKNLPNFLQILNGFKKCVREPFYFCLLLPLKFSIKGPTSKFKLYCPKFISLTTNNVYKLRIWFIIFL